MLQLNYFLKINIEKVQCIKTLTKQFPIKPQKRSWCFRVCDSNVGMYGQVAWSNTVLSGDVTASFNAEIPSVQAKCYLL